MSNLRPHQIFIDSDNQDVWDSLNPVIRASLPSGMVEDTTKNRTDMSLSVLIQLTKRIQILERKLYKLENPSDGNRS